MVYLHQLKEMKNYQNHGGYYNKKPQYHKIYVFSKTCA